MRKQKIMTAGILAAVIVSALAAVAISAGKKPDADKVQAYATAFASEVGRNKY